MPRSYPLAKPEKNPVEFLRVPVHPVGGAEDVHHFIEEVITGKKKAVIFNLNIHAMVISFRSRWYRNFIRKAHLIFCDGDGVRWGMRVLGLPPPPKMGTTRWIWDLAGFCAKKGYRIYFLGGKPGIAAEAARRLKDRHAKLQVAGVHDGYFKHWGQENEAVIAEINAARADVLMVCMGMPLQEKWILKNMRRLDVHILAKGGAVLDYVTGQLGQVPEWMLRLNLEWLFRVWEEPRRLFWRYAHDIPTFFYFVFREKLKRRFTSRRSRKKQSG